MWWELYFVSFVEVMRVVVVTGCITFKGVSAISSQFIYIQGANNGWPLQCHTVQHTPTQSDTRCGTHATVSLHWSVDPHPATVQAWTCWNHGSSCNDTQIAVNTGKQHNHLLIGTFPAYTCCECVQVPRYLTGSAQQYSPVTRMLL